MKLRRILSVILTSAIIAGTAVTAASAKTETTEKTYNYVALGDSIGAGYGLSASGGDMAHERSFVITEDLLANPIEGAYPAVFGSYLKELGQEKGIDVNATNLCAPAYRAEDVEKTITTEGYQGEMALNAMKMMFGKDGGSSLLKPYHEIFNRYLSEADLVSIQLGGNDIMMSVLIPLILDSSNPVTQALSISAIMLIVGYDKQTALGAGMTILNNNKDKITSDMLIEAVGTFLSITENIDQYVDTAAENVKKVVEAVRAINDSTKIAVMGMFNPYGNSNECDGRTYTVASVATSIISRVLELVKEETEAAAEEESVKEVKLLSVDDAQDKMDYFRGLLAKAQDIRAIMDRLKQNAKAGLMKIWKALYDMYQRQLDKLMVILKEELSYPIQYLFAGQTIDPALKSLNEKLTVVADETDSVYVDVYDISNENNLDPHPMAQGHKEIADLMMTSLSDTVTAQMDALASFRNVSTVSAKQIKLGEKVKIRGVAKGGTGDYQYAFYYRKASSSKWSVIHEFSDLRAVNLTPATARDYEILVKIKDATGTVVTKQMKITVTK